MPRNDCEGKIQLVPAEEARRDKVLVCAAIVHDHFGVARVMERFAQ